MTRDEIVVAVIDLEPPGGVDPSPTQRSAPDGPRDVIEGGLLVAVGLATLVVEGLTRAVVAAIGDHLPPAGGPADEDEEDKLAAGSPEAETLAMIAGAGFGIAFGTARFATRMVAGIDRVIRPFSLVAMIPPVDRAARRLERSAIQLNEGWRDERLESQRVAEAFADALVPDLVDAIIDRLDLTTLVLERVDLDQVAGSLEMSELIERVDLDAAVARVDLDAIIERVDLDSVAARIDVERIIDRLDLVAIAQGVIEGLDLPEIIRDSTETMAAETRDGVRVQGMRADRFVSHLVDRALQRERGERPPASGIDAGSSEDPL
jgi:hypothetical protein